MYIKCSRSASVGRTDYSQIDMPGSRYKFFNFGAGKSPGSPHGWA